MSLYRQSGGSRWRPAAVAAVAALLVGCGAGYAIGRSTAPEPTIDEQVAELQDRVQPTLDGLALVPDHYAQGIEAGGSVQFEGAINQATTARDTFAAEADELAALNPAGYQAAEEKITQLLEAIGNREQPARIDTLATAARTAVADASGMDAPGDG